MCHWNTVNWNCIIRKETLEEKLSEEEKHALSRLQKELAEQKKVELLFTDACLPIQGAPYRNSRCARRLPRMWHDEGLGTPLSSTRHR